MYLRISIFTTILCFEGKNRSDLLVKAIALETNGLGRWPEKGKYKIWDRAMVQIALAMEESVVKWLTCLSLTLSQTVLLGSLYGVESCLTKNDRHTVNMMKLAAIQDEIMVLESRFLVTLARPLPLPPLVNV